MKKHQTTTIFSLLTAIFLLTLSAHAATITVNTLVDENNTNNAACSLREAINNANGDNTTNGLGCVAGSGTDDIVFSVSGTINLTAVLPEISSSMNIGNNTTTAPNLTVNRSSGGAYRIFYVFGGNTVTMSGIIITNGNTTDFGGGIRNDGTLTLNNCVISNNNTTNEGTGVFSQGALTVLNTSFLNNSSTAYGGGLSHRFGSALTINNSTFSGNTATIGGGAIDISDPNVTISNTTFNNNSAGFGGGITVAANANFINCTFANNTASSFSSGALFIYNNITANITNSTIVQNSVGGIGVESGSLLTLKNTIVARNTAANLTTPQDITGNVQTGSLNNLIGTGGAGGLTNGVNGNQVGVSFANVGLLPLSNYGGTVQTIPIGLNSPAKNAGTNTGAPATDARGFNRPQETTTDIGAFEIQTNSIVTNINNSGAGSLRQVVADVASGETIQFESPLFDTAQTISLSAGQITIGKNLTISGNGANILNVRNTAAASSTSRVFNISTGFTVNLTGMTISGGNVIGDGGGILQTGNSNLTLTNCAISDNTANGLDGGISSIGTNLTIIGSTISNNSVNNTAGNKGGGIGFAGTSLVITNSTVSGNSSLGGNTNAGGIWTNTTSIITNSTITNNIANGGNSGGGIYKIGANPITVRNSIIAANQNNATIPDVFGVFTSSGYNLVGNRGTATGFNQPTDQTGTNPLFENSNDKSLAPTAVLIPGLLPLAMNGGTLPTHALSGVSLALDKGNSFGSTTDIRGLLRPVDLAGIPNAAGGDGADIGAFEAQFAPTSASVSISGQVFTPDGRGLRNALITITNNQGNSITARTSTFGFYRFDEIQVGENYVIEVRSKNFQFSPQIVSVSEDLTELDFYAVSELMRGK